MLSAFIIPLRTHSCGERPHGARTSAPRTSAALFGALVQGLAALVGCAGAPAEGEPVCAHDLACGEGQICNNGSCVEGVVPASRSVGELACSVVSCPPGTEICCSAARAAATGNEGQAYAPRPHMVRLVESAFGEVRAEFSFDAPNQQGWLTFELGGELDLARLQFTGRRGGVADRFLSVNTNRADSGGCAFAFDLDFRPGPFGSPLSFRSDVAFDDDAFCYGTGRPGRATELAFAIFSTEPGEASLVISNIALIRDFPRGRLP